MKKKISLALFLLGFIASVNAQNDPAAKLYWKLTGNAGTDPATNFLGTTTNKSLSIRTNSVERMLVSNLGYVGIGIPTPLTTLHIAYSGSTTLTSPGSFILGATTSSNLSFDGNEMQSRYNGTGNTLYLNYWGGSVWMGNHGDNVTTPALYANTTGNVGIGSSNITSGYSLTVNTSGGTLNGIDIVDPVDYTGLNINKSGLNYGIYVYKSSTTSSAAAIAATTSSYANAFNGYSTLGDGIAGTTGSTGSGSTGNGVYGYTAGGGSGAGVYGYNSGTGYGVHGYCASGSAVYAHSDNFVGVWGETGNSYSYAGYFVGNVYTTGSYLPSDLKLKKNVKDVNSAMDIINQLHPKQYEYRQDGDFKAMNLPQGNRFGLIAEDVEKVLPNLVKETKYEKIVSASSNTARNTNNGKEGAPTVEDKTKTISIDYKALNYTELIPIMIKAMQEQQQTIDELQRKVDQLSGAADNTMANSNARLEQNSPNPFTQNTIIRCYVPSTVSKAQLVIYSNTGRQVQSFTLTNKGSNQVTVNAGSLSSGQYTYTLFADGKKVDTKNMVLTK